jgi:uncharacterized damage-inducible protein DinB
MIETPEAAGGSMNVSRGELMIEEAIAMWKLYRDGLIDELANIPEEKWEWRPAGGGRSLRELALHIVAAGKGFVEELLGEDTQFMRLRDPKVQQAMIDALGNPASKDEVIALVRNTGAEAFARLRENAERLGRAKMTTSGGEQSRLTGLWFAAAHEMYHRGQVTIYARSMGLVPAMTQRINAASKK